MYFNWFCAFLAIYAIASLAALISEKSGSVNISVDGTMILGGTVFCLLMLQPMFQSDGSLGAFGVYLALLISGFIGVFLSSIYSIATIHFMADNVIVGTAINILTPALGFIIVGAITKQNTILINNNWFIFLGDINLTFIIYAIIGVLLLIGFFVLINKTRWGLRLRTSGENPYALETSGVSVVKTRWIANALSSFFAAIAGGMAVSTLTVFSQSVNGMGYIALAILIFGQWKIVGIGLGTLLMSTIFAWLRVTNSSILIPIELLNIIPFILPIVILIFMKLSSEKKISKRALEFTNKNLKDNKNYFQKSKEMWLKKGLEFKFKTIGIWIHIFIRTISFPFVYVIWSMLYYPIYFICLKLDKKDWLENKIKKEPSIFNSSLSPGSLGMPFKKDIR